jgi:hypothetical protein
METVVVTLTDLGYFHKAKRTLIDVRSRGKWTGDLVLITVGFDAPKNFLDFYNIIGRRVEHINTDNLIQQYKICPINPTCDSREYIKLTQWDKFYVFDDWFSQWKKVLYLDAGLRVLDDVRYLTNLPCEDIIMAPDDAPSYDAQKRFGGIIETTRNFPVVNELFKEYSREIINERYFLNCIWMYDTSLLKKVSFSDLESAMNKYPICRCNEMTIMNLLFTFKHKVWRPFPDFIENPRKRLFGWTEHDRDYGPYTTWRDFCFIKYPFTINFDCE